MLERDHLRLPRALIPGLMLLASRDAASPGPPDDVVTRLERLRLIEGGQVTEAARRAVGVMTGARVVISVECHSADLPYRSTIWSRDDVAIWGRPMDADVFELRLIDPIQLPLLLAQVTDVGHRPQPPFSGSVTVPNEPLDAVRRHDHDLEACFGILVSAGVDPVWADRLLIALEHRRIEWTVSSVWTDPDGAHGLHETTVLDAGSAGYWHVDRDDDADHTTFRVGSAAGVMRELRRCVPSWWNATV